MFGVSKLQSIPGVPGEQPHHNSRVEKVGRGRGREREQHAVGLSKLTP